MTLFIWASWSRAPVDPIVICGYIYNYISMFISNMSGLVNSPFLLVMILILSLSLDVFFSFGFCRRRWFVGVWRGGFICVCTLQKRKVTMLHPQQPRPPTPSMSNESMVNPIFNVE